MDIKELTKPHLTEYRGKNYEFDPTLFGMGFWKEKDRQSYPTKAVREILNEKVFGEKILPTLYKRFELSDGREKEKLKINSVKWLKDKVTYLKQTKKIIKNPVIRKKTTFQEGQMYFYAYDAKHKKTLPFWDAFPLIVVLETSGEGFLGLNLHYLPTNLRLIFLSKLLEDFSTYYENKDVLRLAITYNSLKGVSSLKEFKPCIKKYLMSNIVSHILSVEAHEWMYAAALPSQNFQKENASNVWKNSEEIIKNG